MPEIDERRLVERMRAGDESAFDDFAERWVPGLYRFALRRLHGDRELTREIVQATVCKVIAKLDDYRAEAPLFTWMCACCRNEIAGHFRRLARRPREVELVEAASSAGAAAAAGSVGAVAMPAAAGPGPEERFLRLERAELVHVALDRLPPDYARAVEWRYLEGVEVAEVARRLESSYKAAESLLSRARRAFREAFERLARTPSPREVAAAAATRWTEP
jgi:RNA polymerase sigma-70 factor (ECF subfamily)